MNYYTFKVTGLIGIAFPVDMLRHDYCWPATSEDACLMANCLDVHRRAAFHKPVTITLRSIQHPTIDRWKSFGWTVKEG